MATNVEDPDAEPAVVRERLEWATGADTAPGLIALVDPGGPIDSRAARAKVNEVADIVAWRSAECRGGDWGWVSVAFAVLA